MKIFLYKLKKSGYSLRVTGFFNSNKFSVTYLFFIKMHRKIHGFEKKIEGGSFSFSLILRNVNLLNTTE